jgi:hypothetical protein
MLTINDFLDETQVVFLKWDATVHASLPRRGRTRSKL